MNVITYRLVARDCHAVVGFHVLSNRLHRHCIGFDVNAISKLCVGYANLLLVLCSCVHFMYAVYVYICYIVNGFTHV